MSQQFYHAWIGTNSIRGSRGIYSVRLDADTLQPSIISASPSYNSGSLALSTDERFVYAAVEGMTFDGYADGGVVAYEAAPDGRLQRISGQRTFGQRTCCVAVDHENQSLYAANFMAGTLTAFDLAQDGTIGPARFTVAPQEVSGPPALHYVEVIDDCHVGVMSLAEFALIIYRSDTGERVCSCPFDEVDTAAGQKSPFGKHPFPRVLAVYGKYIYVMMQSPAEIYVYENRLKEERSLRRLQKISVMPPYAKAPESTSAIRITPQGDYVLAANRPTHTITMFARTQEGTLLRMSVNELPKEVPRDFHLSRDGRFLIAAMQASDQITVQEIDHAAGRLRETGYLLDIPSPAAVVISGLRTQDGEGESHE